MDDITAYAVVDCFLDKLMPPCSMDDAEHSEKAISGVDEVTAEWLTGILRKHARAKALTVVTVKIVFQKRLPYSTIIRLAATYNDASVTLPRNFVLKLNPGEIADRSTADVGRAEVEFYRSMAVSMPCPPLVECFDAVYSVESRRSHILMEDLTSTHSQPDQNMAPLPLVSRLAVESLAIAHASWWNSPELGRGIGTLYDDETLASFVSDLKQSVSDFVARSGIELTGDHMDAYQLMVKNADRIWGRLTQREGLTITHGDCHWWNFLYPNDPANDTVRIFDWHLWHVDLGARDLAFLLALGGFAEPRPELEDELLSAYYATLIDNGVLHYSIEQLVDDYRWSAIRNLNIPVILGGQGKHESTVRTALNHAFESYKRLRCEELLA